MSILKEMGVQQWRLRSAANTVEIETAPPEPLNEPTAEKIGQGIARPDVAKPHIVEPRIAEGSIERSDVVDSSKADTPHVNTQPVAAPLPLTPVSATPKPKAPAVTQDPISELDWQGLQGLVDGQSQCVSCGVGKSLLGAGDPNASWLFVIDAPHSQDVMSQQLLNARAGQLFDAMLSAIGLERGSVYMTSVFKCVASGDLSQTPNCDKILHRQIELVQPQVVVALGEFAAQSAIKANESLDVLRASAQHCFRTKVPIVPTYTPAQMLEEPTLKAAVWEDLKRCLEICATHS